MKKRILIAYQSMNIGGSTTSLLGLLDALDYSQVSVDLQLYNNVGPYMEMIPQQINILPPARTFSENKLMGMIQRMAFPIYWRTFFKLVIAKKKYPNTKATAQISAYARAKTSRENREMYDVAIGFMEMWPDCYVYGNVKAKKKIAWIHVDYTEAGLIADIDRTMLMRFDTIVLVSKKCLAAFNRAFPELSDKAICIENILSKKTVVHRAEAQRVELTKRVGLTFGTVCRIDFQHKGLDRAVEAFYRLKGLKYEFTWHIIGDGDDFQRLEELIKEKGLTDRIFLYGSKDNPLPYVKQFDVFLLPSRYEGKPMAVTEAQVLNVPALVTNYASAKEQVNNGIDGLVVDNSSEGIFKGLKYVLDHMEELKKWKGNISNFDVTNNQAECQICRLIYD